jgi:hypothetical protein
MVPLGIALKTPLVMNLVNNTFDPFLEMFLEA